MGEVGEGAGVEGCPVSCERSHCREALVEGRAFIYALTKQTLPRM